MPHEGYADPVTKDGLGFHSNMPVSELTERVTRAIEASNVSSAPPVAKTADRVTHGTRPTPAKPNGARGLRSPDTNSEKQPTAQIVGGTNTGEHPEREYVALGKRVPSCSASNRLSRTQAQGLHPRVRSCGPAVETKNSPAGKT